MSCFWLIYNMNRRSFFTKLGAGLIVTACPNIFVPQLIRPVWKVNKNNDVYACYIGPVIKNLLRSQTTSTELLISFGYFESLDNSLSFPLDLYHGPHPKMIRRESII